MGYNTTLLILNDSVGSLEKYPTKFAEKLLSIIGTGYSGDISLGEGTVAKVMRTAHADTFRLYCTEGNQITDLSLNYKLLDRCKSETQYKKIIEERIKWAKQNLKDLETELNKI